MSGEEEGHTRRVIIGSSEGLSTQQETKKDNPLVSGGEAVAQRWSLLQQRARDRKYRTWNHAMIRQQRSNVLHTRWS